SSSGTWAPGASDTFSKKPPAGGTSFAPRQPASARSASAETSRPRIERWRIVVEVLPAECSEGAGTHGGRARRRDCQRGHHAAGDGRHGDAAPDPPARVRAFGRGRVGVGRGGGEERRRGGGRGRVQRERLG